MARSPARRRSPAADQFRQARLTAGLSQHEIAAALSWSQGKVAKIETGRTRPSPADAEAWAQVTGLSADDAAALVTAADEGTRETSSYADQRRADRRRAQYAKWEAETRHLRDYQVAFLPGLLQTAEYARRAGAAAGITDLPGLVANRLERQRVLYGDRKFTFVLAEAALRWRPGPAEVMAEQADRIISVATLANVTLSVIPADRESRVLAPSGFSILSPSDGPVVLIELLTGDQFIRDRDQVAAYVRTFTRLTAEAVGGQRAADLIRGLITRPRRS